MRRTTFGVCAAMALSGCGSAAQFANKPRPPIPVNLTVYIDNSRVSVSPTKAGAGEVILVVTNQADKPEALNIHAATDSSRQLATTGPIQPQATGQVAVDLNSPGEYTVSTAASGQNEATLATAARIQPAAIRIGPPRPNSRNVLLQP